MNAIHKILTRLPTLILEPGLVKSEKQAYNQERSRPIIGLGGV